MISSLLARLRRPPLRLRITAWYVLVLAVSALIVGGFFYLELHRSLYATVDLSLRAAASQAAATIEAEKSAPSLMKEANDIDVVVRNRGHINFAVRLLTRSGNLAEGHGAYRSGPKWPNPVEGFSTVGGRGGSWRVLTEPVVAQEKPGLGWIQVAQPISYITDALRRLRTVLLLAIPLMLLLAGAGGVLLVHEALRPLSAVTATAQSISSSDLSRRIAYAGPEDELAQLSRTFDRMLDRLEQGFELERRFTADASHELRTPLTALKGQIDVALSKERSAPEYREILGWLAKEADRLIRLGNDLLLLSRIDLPRGRSQALVINLTDLLQATLDQIAPLAEQKGIRIEGPPEEGAIEVRGDFDQLVRLFLNILDNAVKYTPPKGEIRLSMARSSPERVVVTIANTGAGFSAVEAERVFERFYRLSSDRSRGSGGSGLGLSIAREIARAHKGDVYASSRPGELTTFTVELPALARRSRAGR